MSRPKARGTTNTFRSKYPGGKVEADSGLAMAMVAQQAKAMVLAAEQEATVAKTMLAVVLNNTPEKSVIITPEMLAELQGKEFLINREGDADGNVAISVVVDPKGEVEEPPKEDDPQPPKK